MGFGFPLMKSAALLACSIAKYFITSICPFGQEKFCAAAIEEATRIRATTGRVIYTTSSGELLACKHEPEAQVALSGRLYGAHVAEGCSMSKGLRPPMAITI